MSRFRPERGSLVGLLAGIGVLLACAAPAGRPESGGAAGGERVGPRTLRMVESQPSAGLVMFATGRGPGTKDLAALFHSGLTQYDAKGNVLPRLAEKLPSTTDGDWKLLTDGSMEVTWKLHSGVFWHDGEPFGAQDLVFGVRLLQDRGLPHAPPSWIALISGAEAVDPLTLRLRWSEPYAFANVSAPLDIIPVPAHLLQNRYETGDKTTFANLPYWASEFVGLGPYRLARWEAGVLMEGAAFDRYFLGRPKIDRIEIRDMEDLNTIFANLMAGELDIFTASSLFEPSMAAEIKKHWEPTNGGTVGIGLTLMRLMELQYRDPQAPWARDLRVRQALASLTDRQQLVEVMLHGFGVGADLYALPDDPVRSLIDTRGLASYPYDPARAERLLAEGGWSRAADRMVRNARGETFDITVTVNSESDLPEALAIADGWKQGGLNPTAAAISSRNSERGTREQAAGTQNSSRTAGDFERYLSTAIAGPANRWSGRNTSGYVNVDFDRLYGQYLVTLDRSAQNETKATLVKMLWDNLVYIPIWYQGGLFAHRTGVRGLAGVGANSAFTWNVHEWEIE